MSVIRLILLLAVLGCLTLLLVQNWSPVLPLVFLGLQSQPLPLSMWILFSVVAGAFTSLFITGCFQLSNYFAQSKPRKRRKAAETSPPRSTQSSKANYTAANTSQPKTASTTSDNFNEWESDASDDDWDFDAKTDKTPKYDTQEPVKDRTNYEVNNEPKSSSRSGSVYSYSYREPSNSGVGKTESVYDADYRVLTPPYQQSNTSNTSNTSQDDDDWGFEDDEDWEDEGRTDAPRPKK